ncbi:MAG TPA: hypothetical protein VFZ32_07815 [Micromonosporaceae bacterium]
MAQARFLVQFTPAPHDDDFQLGQLTHELAADLSELGETEYIPTSIEPDSKGVAEIALATLSVITSTEPSYLQAVVETLVAFLNRNAGRRGYLRVGDIELAIDRPTHEEIAEMIRTVRYAIERAGE